jgi:UDP-glucose 6-dehydrogenase
MQQEALAMPKLGQKHLNQIYHIMEDIDEMNLDEKKAALLKNNLEISEVVKRFFESHFRMEKSFANDWDSFAVDYVELKYKARIAEYLDEKSDQI